MADFESEGSRFICRGIGGILWVTLREWLDDGSCGGEGAGLDCQYRRGCRESSAGSSKLQHGAEKYPAHYGPQCLSGLGTIAGQLRGMGCRP